MATCRDIVLKWLLHVIQHAKSLLTDNFQITTNRGDDQFASIGGLIVKLITA